MKYRLLTILLPYDTVTLARGLRYSTLSVSREETDNTDGVKFISKDVQPNPDPNGPPVVHTLKDFYLDKRIPSFYRKFLPSSSLIIVEECWSTELTSTGQRVVSEEIERGKAGEGDLSPLTDQKVNTVYHSDYFKKLDIRVKSVIARANVGNTIQGDTREIITKLFGELDGIHDKNIDVTNELVDLSKGYGEGHQCSVVFKLVMVDFPYALRSMCENFVIKKISGVLKSVHETVVKDEAIWSRMTDEELDKMEDELMKSGKFRSSKGVIDEKNYNTNTREGEAPQYQIQHEPQIQQQVQQQPEVNVIQPPGEYMENDVQRQIPNKVAAQRNNSVSSGIGSDTALHNPATQIPYPPQTGERTVRGTDSWATGPSGGQ